MGWSWYTHIHRNEVKEFRVKLIFTYIEVKWRKVEWFWYSHLHWILVNESGVTSWSEKKFLYILLKYLKETWKTRNREGPIILFTWRAALKEFIWNFLMKTIQDWAFNDRWGLSWKGVYRFVWSTLLVIRIIADLFCSFLQWM